MNEKIQEKIQAIEFAIEQQQRNIDKAWSTYEVKEAETKIRSLGLQKRKLLKRNPR